MNDRRTALSRNIATYLPLLLLGAACARLQSPVEVSAGPGMDQVVSVTASSFEFRPNNILAKPGGILDLAVTNSSGTTHNLTVKAPDGTPLVTVDLPGNSVTHARVPLAVPGIYEFYCNKPTHALLGMQGRIEAR